MKYHDTHNTRMPKHMIWPCIELPNSLGVVKQEDWCDQHESKGRYYRRLRTIYHPEGGKTYITLWYFEFETDAIMFALKCK